MADAAGDLAGKRKLSQDSFSTFTANVFVLAVFLSPVFI